SSLFDGLMTWYKGVAGIGIHSDDLYFRKDALMPFNWPNSVVVSMHGETRPTRGSLYVRTAYRNDPDFSIAALSQQRSPSDGIRFHRAIDNDITVGQNYQRLLYETMTGVYDPANANRTVESLREALVGEIRDSMKRVFGDLILRSISDPL